MSDKKITTPQELLNELKNYPTKVRRYINLDMMSDGVISITNYNPFDPPPIETLFVRFMSEGNYELFHPKGYRCYGVSGDWIQDEKTGVWRTYITDFDMLYEEILNVFVADLVVSD